MFQSFLPTGNWRDAVLTLIRMPLASIMESMQVVLNDQSLQNKMIQLGKSRLEKFSWNLHTQKILNTFNEMNK